MANRPPVYKYVIRFTHRGKRRQKTIYAMDGYTAGKKLLEMYPTATKLLQV